MRNKFLFLVFWFCGSCSSESSPPVENVDNGQTEGPAITDPEDPAPRTLRAVFKQINREDKTETFKLKPGTAFSETMVKADPAEVRGKIDILIVVDNSGSMAEEQRNLSTKINPLLNEIKEQDWQIMVITTDNPCPTHEKLPFNKDTENLLSEFAEAIDVGTSGLAQEKAIEMTYNHLHGSDPDERCHASSWMRPTAGFSMLILSDEDEDKTTTVGPSRFINAIQQFGYEAGFNARVFGIISRPDEPCSSAQQPAKIYDDLIVRTGGISGDICAADYTETLEMISVMMTDLVVSEMALEHAPEPSSLTVLLNGQPMAQEYWRLTGNMIVFAYSFVTGDTVKVEYVTEYQRSFPLKREPSNLSVRVDDNILADNQFSLIIDNESPSKRYLLYLPNLAVDSEVIVVTYKENTPLKKRFPFEDYIGGKLTCQIKDARPVEATYHKTDRSISFNPSPTDGEEVICEFPP